MIRRNYYSGKFNKCSLHFELHRIYNLASYKQFIILEDYNNRNILILSYPNFGIL